MTRQRADDPRNAAVVRAAARAGDRDRYLAALLAPARARGDLIALTAFLGEVARIPDAVHEPMMGEIRLQWWRDALETLRAGGKTGNPVADALGPVIASHALPQELLVSVIEGRRRDLEPGRHDLGERMPELAGYIAETDGAAFRLSARVLGVEASPAVSDLLAASAEAYGRARIVRAAVRAGESDNEALHHEARGWLKEVRLRAAAAPRAVIPAILPVALVEPYLAALERPGPGLFRRTADISPLTRVWRLWRAGVLGRV
jgi:15-cis-phytoene synthase